MNNLKNEQKTPSVFILDDDKFYLEYMKEIISNYSSSIKTQTFVDKKALLGQLNNKPDVIFLDYNLGIENSTRMTAHAVIADIESQNPDQYIVLISGESATPLLEEYNRYRKLDFLVKTPNVGQDIVSLLNRKIKITH